MSAERRRGRRDRGAVRADRPAATDPARRRPAHSGSTGWFITSCLLPSMSTTATTCWSAVTASAGSTAAGSPGCPAPRRTQRSPPPGDTTHDATDEVPAPPGALPARHTPGRCAPPGRHRHRRDHRGVIVNNPPDSFGKASPMPHPAGVTPMLIRNERVTPSPGGSGSAGPRRQGAGADPGDRLFVESRAFPGCQLHHADFAIRDGKPRHLLARTWQQPTAPGPPSPSAVAAAGTPTEQAPGSTSPRHEHTAVGRPAAT